MIVVVRGAPSVQRKTWHAAHDSADQVRVATREGPIDLSAAT